MPDFVHLLGQAACSTDSKGGVKHVDFHQQDVSRGQLLKLTIYMDGKQKVTNSCHHTCRHYTLHQKLVTRQAQTHFLIFPLNVASTEQTIKQNFFPQSFYVHLPSAMH